MEAREFISLSFSARKRALFPVDSGKLTNNDGSGDDDELLNDIVPMSQISSESSSPERYSSPTHSPRSENSSLKLNSPASSNCLTPVRGQSFTTRDLTERIVAETPQQRRIAFVDFMKKIVSETPERNSNDIMIDFGDEIVAETPEKRGDTDGIISPLKGLVKRIVIEETPDNASSFRSNISSMKLSKKRLGERHSLDVDRKPLFDFNSSAARLIQKSFYKPQQNGAKVALFPERIGGVKRPLTTREELRPRPRLNASFPGYRSHHSHKRRRIVGEINHGVFHRVKKPKSKKRSSSELVKPALEVPKIQPVDRLADYWNKELVQSDSPVDFGAPQKKQKLSDGTAKENSKLVVEAKLPPTPEPELEPDPTRKFFKTNRTITHRATVTVADNVKIQVNRGKLALESSAKKPKSQKNVLISPEDIVKDFEEDLPTNCKDSVQETVEEVLKKLDEEDNHLGDTSGHIQNITTSTSCLVLDDKREEQGVAEASLPEKADGLEKDSGNYSPKYFPVFYKDAARTDSPADTPKRSSSSVKKCRPIGDDQYLIDAGQRNLRLDQCHECGVVYNKGDPDDEMDHMYIHNNVRPLKFAGWKNERVVKMYPDGKVIVIYPDDPKAWLKKAKEVLDVADRELGYVDGYSQTLEHCKVYLYVSKNRVLGVLAALPRTEAYLMLSLGVDGPDCCSEEAYPVKCGVNRLWTVFDQRRKGIASRLMDCLRLSFMFDRILTLNDIAFSVPTENGKAFAEKYLKTREFMVYY